MLRRSAYTLLSILIVAVLIGCNSSTQDVSRMTALEGKVSVLESEIAALKEQLAKQNQRVDGVEFTQRLKDWEGIAYLTPGSTGYSVVRMDLGNLTVSLSNVAAYANGSKITLQFGNLTSATIDGLKAKIEWGSVNAKGTPNNSEARSKEFSVTESVLPGSWSSTEVVLENVPPTSLGFVRIREVSHRALRMRGS